MDMLLASSVMLSKIINSTFGNGEMKGFDESAVEKIYEEFKNNIRMIGSDKIIYAYPVCEWEDWGGIGSRHNVTSREIYFPYNGTARFKLIVDKAVYSNSVQVSVCDSDGNPLQSINIGSTEKAEIEVSIEVDVLKNKGYKIKLVNKTAGYHEYAVEATNLRICADVVIPEEQITLIT